MRTMIWFFGQMKSIPLSIVFFLQYTFLGAIVPVHYSSAYVDSLIRFSYKDSILPETYAGYIKNIPHELKFLSNDAKAYYALGLLEHDRNKHGKAIYALKRSLILSQKTSDNIGIMECYYWIARCYRRIADYPNYQKYLSLLASFASKHNQKKYLSYAYEGYGNLYRYIGDYPLSIKNYMKAIDLSEELGNLEDLAMALNNMSLVYGYMGNQEEELKIQLRNYSILQALDKKPDLILCLGNLSGIYLNMGNIAKASEYIEKSMRLINIVGPDNVPFKNLGSAYRQYARLKAAKGEYKKAIAFFDKDLKLRIDNNDVKAISESYGDLAGVFEKMNDLNLSEKFLLKQVEISKSIGYMNGYMEACNALTGLKARMGDYKSAYFYQCEYMLLNDSLKKMTNEKQITDVETQFKIKEQQQQLKIVSKDNVMKAMELDRKNIIAYILGIGLLFISLIVILIFNGYRKKRIANIQLEETVKKRTMELLQKNHDLKTFIYKSSHELRSPLATTKGLINIAQSGTTDPLIRNYLSKILFVAEKQDEMLKSLLKTSKLFDSKIKVEKIDVKNLFEEVTSELKTVHGNESVDTIITVKEGLEINTDKTLFSTIIQNLVTNGLQYADQKPEPSFVKLEATQHKTGVLVKISDNGEGIPEMHREKIFELFCRATHKSKGFGLGLYIVRNSVDMLGGTLNVESELGHGSIFSIWIPKLAI